MHVLVAGTAIARRLDFVWRFDSAAVFRRGHACSLVVCGSPLGGLRLCCLDGATRTMYAVEPLRTDEANCLRWRRLSIVSTISGALPVLGIAVLARARSDRRARRLDEDRRGTPMPGLPPSRGADHEHECTPRRAGGAPCCRPLRDRLRPQRSRFWTKAGGPRRRNRRRLRP